MVFIWAYKITLYEGSSLLSPCSSTLLSINAVEIDPEVDTDNLDTPSRSHLLLHRSGPFVVLLAGHGNGWEMRWQLCAVVQCVLALLGSHDWKVSPMQQVQDKVHELVTQLETLHSQLLQGNEEIHHYTFFICRMGSMPSDSDVLAVLQSWALQRTPCGQSGARSASPPCTNFLPCGSAGRFLKLFQPPYLRLATWLQVFFPVQVDVVDFRANIGKVSKGISWHPRGTKSELVASHAGDQTQ